MTVNVFCSGSPSSGSWRGFDVDLDEFDGADASAHVESGSGDSKEQPRGQVGQSILFYGGRMRSTDFLYQAEFAALQASGILTNWQLAFSREQATKVSGNT
jgi:hypothetical protein